MSLTATWPCAPASPTLAPDPDPGLAGERFVGSSASVRELLTHADRLAASELPLLVTGESGTGKEVLARRIHARSARRDGPFVAENCSAIPAELMESEVFGHVRGAFTGAERDHDGLFARADGGTLFLDEIGDMPVGLQAKLLRVLQEGRFRPVGGREERRVDVRIVCATHRDLPARVREGAFREDLYFRLNGALLEIPPLRSRLEDLAELADHFLRRLNAEHGTRKVLGDRVLSRLRLHRWPGNVRELGQELARLFVLSDGDVLDETLLDGKLEERAVGRAGGTLLNDLAPLAEIEKEAIQLALERTEGNRREAAVLLGISRSCLYDKLRRYGLGQKPRPQLVPLGAVAGAPEAGRKVS